MIKCPKCNRELSDGAKFCAGCGSPVFETIFCPNCGKQTSTEFAFCQSCGASVTKTPAAEQTAAPVTEQVKSAPVGKKKLPKKAILFGGIGVAVIAVLIIVIALVSGKSENNYALYVKDGEIYYNDLKKSSESLQLTSRLYDSGEVSDEALSESGYQLGCYTYMSENGKYIFFPDKIGDGDSGFNLYYKEVSDLDEEATKIDSDVRLYFVNSSATRIIYLKGDEGDLYLYNIGKDSKEKITSDVISIEHLNEDFSTLYYIKDGSLYKYVVGKDSDKVVSDVYEVVKIYDSGEIYYLKSENEELSLMDYIIDDMKDTDASLSEPVYPEYPESPSRPSSLDYNSDAEYEAAYETYQTAYAEWQEECDRIESEYETARAAYIAKLSRDDMRAALEEETLERSGYSLYYYDGAEDTVITDAAVGGYYSAYACASDKPVISYEAYNQSGLEKVKLSEVESIDDIEDMVKAALSSSSERYVAVKTVSAIVEQEKYAHNFTINDAGTIAYYIDNVPDDKNYGDLYRISIDGDSLGKAEVYDSDVYTGFCFFISDDDIEYFKDCKNGNGDMYINKNKIDSDVYYYSIAVYSDLDEIFYVTDWSEKKEYGTLKVYNGKKSETVTDDMHSYRVTPDGRVLCLIDFSMNSHKGELIEWSDGKTRKIDDDVVCILPVFSSNTRGSF